MGLYLVTCIDKADALELRLATRPAHLDYVRGLGARIKLGGPFLDPDGETPRGSVLLIEARDRPALDAILHDDPYVRAGLFAEIDVKLFRWVVNAPLEGHA